MKTFLIVAGLLAAPGAHAQAFVEAEPPHQPEVGLCSTYDNVVASLMIGFGEISSGRTLVEQTGTAVEVFIGPMGSLTVVEVFPDNEACYRAFNDPKLPPWGTPPPGRRSS